MTSTISSPALSESYLVGSAVAGDRAAFAALYEMHYQPLVSKVTYAYLGGNPERAADIAQQGFLEVFRNIRHIDRTQSFANLLINAVSEGVLNSDKHDQLERADAFEELQQGFLEPEERDPTKLAESRQLAENRRSALEMAVAMNNASGKKYAAGIRYVFDLCNGMSFDDIAAREGKTSARVQKDIARARDILRPILDTLVP